MGIQSRRFLGLLFLTGAAVSISNGIAASADLADALAGGVAGGYAIGNLGPTFYAFNNLQPTVLSAGDISPAVYRRNITDFSGKVIGSYNPSIISAAKSYDYTRLQDIVNLNNLMITVYK